MKWLLVTLHGKNDRGMPSEWPKSVTEVEAGEVEKTLAQLDAGSPRPLVMTPSDYDAYRKEHLAAYEAWAAREVAKLDAIERVRDAAEEFARKTERLRSVDGREMSLVCDDITRLLALDAARDAIKFPLRVVVGHLGVVGEQQILEFADPDALHAHVLAVGAQLAEEMASAAEAMDRLTKEWRDGS